MRQQINFYKTEFRSEEQIFSAMTLLKGCAAIVFAMFLAYAFAVQKVGSIESESQIVARQETAAVERLVTIRPIIANVGGERTWSERLDDATRSLEEKQLVLSLLQGTALGDTKGFSRYLRSLARQNMDGLWLTHINLSALGDKTRLEGKALRGELVPVYLQNLADEPPFAEQRFNQFQINGAEEPGSSIVSFSIDSEVELIASLANSQ
ncbi:MAG: PilN domain-containing protein [Gammaproteobacteria bacterium]|nr:PilN domain-containing protein [Gammaproteobacteria bacterium]MBT8109304.1 PilN domain-containing protein [Gammaproteobacteria bacterium]NND46282.1 PilN domain-containing protein [Woeseiaceae bacterium]NNL44006.1 PilN domain-containing protein [Woeseiaceae bacterium]